MIVAGLDEVGYGALAGPVVVAAVIIGTGPIPDGIDDSKKLTPRKRENLAKEIMLHHQVAITFACPDRIARDNIRQASLWAMAQAINMLDTSPDIALIDGLYTPTGVQCKTQAIVRGDSKSLPIAAASIVAKVCRDRHMIRMSGTYPGYGFEQHVGYGTKKHLESLTRLGACRIHRRNFSPIRDTTTSCISCA